MADLRLYPDLARRLVVLTDTWNLAGNPVAPLPAALGRRSGLPVGVSLIGRRRSEAALVQAAIDLQAGPLRQL